MIQIVDPRGSVATEMEPYELSKDIQAEQGAGVTIALLANGFPDSEVFIRKIGDAIQKRLPDIRTMVWNKGNAGIEVSESMLEEILADCQVAIAAYGHWGSCTTGTVRDGVKLARRGLPAVSLVTEEFWDQGTFVAKSLGMPDIPRVQLPHPIAGTGESNISEVAENFVEKILECFAPLGGNE